MIIETDTHLLYMIPGTIWFDGGSGQNAVYVGRLVGTRDVDDDPGTLDGDAEPATAAVFRYEGTEVLRAFPPETVAERFTSPLPPELTSAHVDRADAKANANGDQGDDETEDDGP